MDTSEKHPDGAAPRRRLNSGIVAAGVAFGITLAGLGVAAAQTDGGSDTTATTAAPTDTAAGAMPAGPETGDTPAPGMAAPRGPRPPRVAETELTGDVADKVRAAAVAAVPGGTVIRVESDSDGSPYEAHVRKADGTEVVVKVDAAFAVTAIEEGGHGHGGRHRGGPRGTETPLTGEVADKVTAAALAAVPGATVIRVESDSDGSTYEAHVAKADGTKVVVKVDAAFAVTGIEEAGSHGPHHHRMGPATAGGEAD